MAELNRLAQDKDLGGLRRWYGPDVLALKEDPLAVIKTGGSYGAGRFGWQVQALAEPGGKQYVVFTTPLTIEDIGERLYEFSEGKLVRYVPEAESGGWAISDHQFHLSFRLATKEAFLTDTLTIKHSGPASSLFLRFSPTYKVKEISDEDSRQTLPFAQAGGIVALGASAASERHLKLTYSGVVNLPNYGGLITNRYANLTDEYWYPMIARQPAPYEATIEVPHGWSAIAQGEVTSHLKTPTKDTWSYKMDLPVSYYSLSAGDYHTYEQKIGARTYRTWSFGMKAEESRWQCVMYSDIVDFFSRTFYPYPFSGYGALDQPNYGDGMLEAYSFNTGQEGSYPAEEPHEPSHTWFGGILGNTYLHSMWNESFANWCEGLYRRNVRLGNTEERRRAFVSVPEINLLYNAAPIADASPEVGPAAFSIGYGKGAYVLQMLEDEMTTPEMLKAIRRWLSMTAKGRAVEWADFERAVGAKYSWFFDQWVHRPGFPVFTVSDVGYADGKVQGKIKFAGPSYRIHMDALLIYPYGERELKKIDTMEIPDGEGFRFTIPTVRKPKVVSLDPYLHVLRPIQNDERPFNASDAVTKLRIVRDPKTPNYLQFLKGTVAKDGPESAVNTLLIGHPETMPAMKELCKRVGFVVNGNELTWKGTTIDLSRGGALAVVDLPGLGRTAIGLGAVHLPPVTGAAQIALFDEYGRFLRGSTAPKVSGNLVFTP